MSDPYQTEPVVHQIGDLKITRIHETELAGFSPVALFPDFADVAEDTDYFPAHMMDDAGGIRLASHSWLVQGPNGTLLVDTGIGNAKQRPLSAPFHNHSNDFLGQLAAASVTPEQVDHVLLTHLHVDHVGWNTHQVDGVWIPTFSNATHVFSRDEYRFFADPANLEPRHRNSFLARQDSIDPVVANNQANMININDTEVMPGVRYISTPGHSPFHASIVMTSGDDTAIFAGDTLHHVAQVKRPSVNSIFDADPLAACTSRNTVLELASSDNTLLFGAHISGRSVLNISKSQNGFIWEEG